MKPKRAEPYRRINLHLPAYLLAQVELLLFSKVEGRVPFGAYSRLVTELLTQWVEGVRDKT